MIIVIKDSYIGGNYYMATNDYFVHCPDKCRCIDKTIIAYSDNSITIRKQRSINFTMVSCKPASNNNNASYYRLTATFTATVDADGHIYTRK